MRAHRIATRGLLLAIAATCLALPLSTPASGAPEPPSCAGADVLRGAKLFDQATSAYADLLKTTPDLACAQQGLLAIPHERAAQALAVAMQLHRSGFEAPAAEQLKAALAADPSVAIPPELAGLADTIAAQDAFQSARNLRDRGFHDEARAALQKAITEHPRATVPDDLRGLNVAAPAMLAWVVDALALAGSLLNRSLAVLVLGGYLIWLAISSVCWWSPKKRWELALGDFDGAEATVAKPFARLIAETVRKLDKDGGGSRVYVNDYTEQDFQMPDLADAFPQVKGLAALLNLARSLVPEKLFTLTGAIQPAGSQGQGVTLVLRRHVILWSTTVDAITIWEADIEQWAHPRASTEPDHDSLHRLAVAAAVWVGYAIPEHVTDGSLSTARYATGDWRSYACFAFGTIWRDAGDPERARRLFLRAIEIDAGNELAWSDLGVLDWLEADPTGDPSAYERGMSTAARRLAHARTLMEAGGRTHDAPQTEGWYRCMYSLVAVQTEALVRTNLLPPDAPPSERSGVAWRPLPDEDLIADASVLVLAAAAVLDAQRDDKVRRFLARSEGAMLAELALAILADEWADLAPRVPPARPADERRVAALRSLITNADHAAIAVRAAAAASVTRLVRYNLACYYAIRSVQPGRPRELQRADRDVALGELRAAADGQGADWVERARRDICLQPLRSGDRGAFDDILDDVRARAVTVAASADEETTEARR